MAQDRWADNTGTDVRQSGGIPSEETWAPVTSEEEAMLNNTRAMPGPPSDFKVCPPDDAY